MNDKKIERYLWFTTNNARDLVTSYLIRDYYACQKIDIKDNKIKSIKRYGIVYWEDK